MNALQQDLYDTLTDPDTAELAFPEVVTWTRAGHTPVTVRCALVTQGDVSFQRAQQFSTLPSFVPQDVVVTVHPDDTLPGLGSVAASRIGRLTVKAFGKPDFWTGLRPIVCGAS